MYKECEVVMLPTKEKSNETYVHFKNNQLAYFNNKVIFKGKEQHLYILSDDEIKEGDWYMSSLASNVSPILSKGKNSENFYKHESTRKIIATTDKALIYKYDYHGEITNDISKECYVKSLPQTQKAFIREYCAKGGIDKVMVEYIEDYTPGIDDNGYGFPTGDTIYKPKLSEDNIITIQLIKENYSREEVIQKLKEFAYSGYSKEQVQGWTKKNL